MASPSLLLCGKSLSDKMIIPRLTNQAVVEKSLVHIRQTANSTHHNYLLVVGHLEEFSKNNNSEDIQLKLECFRTPFLVNKSIWETGMRHKSYAGLDSALASANKTDNPSRTLVIGKVEVNSDGEIRLLNLAFQVLSKEWIPVESGYELSTVNQLVNEHRWFSKPMSPQNGMKYIPDIIFHDTWITIYGEIYGRKDVKYRNAFETKKQWFAKHYPGQSWNWDATADHKMPPFPPKAE